MDNDILDFAAKLMQPSLLGRVTEYVHTRATTGPLVVELDPTTECNFVCPECISISLLNKGQIEAARTITLIDELHRAGVKGVIFIGGGEPLAQKGMPAPILRCSKLGIKVGLTTNGFLIKRYIEAISECVSWTRVSVDAACQETFSTFRPSNIPSSFSKITANIELLAKSKNGLLGYSFLLIERDNPRDDGIVTNVHEVYEAARLAKELGCDYFEFKPMVDKYHNLIPLSPNARESLAAQMGKIQSLNKDGFRVIAPGSISHLLNGRSIDQPKNYTTCPAMEMRTLITPKGIYPCPYKRGYEELKLGDIDTRFDEYWISQKRHELAARVNPSKDCPFYCIRHRMNITLLSLVQAYENGVDMLPCMIGIEFEDVFI
jgi:MoaA/NifB/PqqE/SkfB family radical SAM enzyme